MLNLAYFAIFSYKRVIVSVTPLEQPVYCFKKLFENMYSEMKRLNLVIAKLILNPFNMYRFFAGNFLK